MHEPHAPLAPGSVSLRLYPHLDRPAPEIVAELRAQAALAIEHGFDGVMTSEHHGGFAGYLPNPLQAASWCLDATTTGWAAACPLLLPLRPVALVAEEVAWLEARFPGRVGVGVAAGALAADFEVMDSNLERLAARYTERLTRLARLLRCGDPGGPLEGDPAIAACGARPIPMVSAASSRTAARRAATNGVGILLDSLAAPERARELTDAFRSAGGTGACILIRRAWLGEPPRARFAQQTDVYRGYAPSNAQQNWGEDEQVVATEPLASPTAWSTRCADQAAMHSTFVCTCRASHPARLASRSPASAPRCSAQYGQASGSLRVASPWKPRSRRRTSLEECA